MVFLRAVATRWKEEAQCLAQPHSLQLRGGHHPPLELGHSKYGLAFLRTGGSDWDPRVLSPVRATTLLGMPLNKTRQGGPVSRLATPGHKTGEWSHSGPPDQHTCSSTGLTGQRQGEQRDLLLFVTRVSEPFFT